MPRPKLVSPPSIGAMTPIVTVRWFDAAVAAADTVPNAAIATATVRTTTPRRVHRALKFNSRECDRGHHSARRASWRLRDADELLGCGAHAVGDSL